MTEQSDSTAMTTDRDLLRLAPCPFCGSMKIDPEGWMGYQTDGVTKASGPACDDCGASAESVERWNTRAISAEPCAVKALESIVAEHIDSHTFEKNDDGSVVIDRAGMILTMSEDQRIRSALVPGGDEPVADDAGVLIATYTNYRGETAVRRIIPKSVRYGSTEWHPEPQWLLLAWDDDKQADREFALKDFGGEKDIQSSDGGAEAGSSPILASKEKMRARAHGVMPVGDSADASGCTDVGPSDPSPAPVGDVREAVHVGIDYGSKDETALMLRRGDDVFTFTGVQAEIIIAALSAGEKAAAVACGYQWLHHSPMSGNEVWLDKEYYNGHRSTTKRPIYTTPPTAPAEATPSTAGSVREALEPFATYEMVAVGFNGTISKDDLKDCLWIAGFKGPQPEFRHFESARLALSAPVEAPVAVKPVAWRKRYKSQGDWYYSAERPDFLHPNWPAEVEPLYATPHSLPSRDELERSVRFNSNPLLTDRAIDEQAKKIVGALLTLLGGSAHGR